MREKMSGLLNALSISMGALAANQEEVNVRGTISRIPVLRVTRGGVRTRGAVGFFLRVLGDIGSGVAVGSVESVRDPLLDSGVQQETQQQAPAKRL